MQHDCPASRSLSDRGTPTVTSRVTKLKGTPPGSRVVRAGTAPELPRVAWPQQSEQPACLSLCAGSTAQRPTCSSRHLCAKGLLLLAHETCTEGQRAEGACPKSHRPEALGWGANSPLPSALRVRPDHHSLLGGQAWAPPAPAAQAASRGNLCSPRSASPPASRPQCRWVPAVWSHVAPCYLGSEYTSSIHLTDVRRASVLCQVDGDE